MIYVQNLSKGFGKQTVLQGISFSAEPGAVTLLVGANGVGKTTTMRIVSGLMRPDGGDVTIHGRSIVHERIAAQRNLACLPQGVTFHPRLSCEAILRFYASLRHVDSSRVGPILEMVGLAGERRKLSSKLSGGLRQRLGLGVLLLPDAPVLLLDEPGLSLDPEWRERLKDILKAEASRGKTVLVTTHLLAEWEGVANRCLLVQNGGRVSELNPARIREEFKFAKQQENSYDCIS
jgi:ABC-type multidrug transport system ATPase subunit